MQSVKLRALILYSFFHNRFGWFWTWYVSVLARVFHNSHHPSLSPLDISEKNGCMYRHALPPGFVLRSVKKAMEAAARSEVISLEEFLEVEVGCP